MSKPVLKTPDLLGVRGYRRQPSKDDINGYPRFLGLGFFPTYTRNDEKNSVWAGHKVSDTDAFLVLDTTDMSVDVITRAELKVCDKLGIKPSQIYSDSHELLDGLSTCQYITDYIDEFANDAEARQKLMQTSAVVRAEKCKQYLRVYRTNFGSLNHSLVAGYMADSLNRLMKFLFLSCDVVDFRISDIIEIDLGEIPAVTVMQGHKVEVDIDYTSAVLSNVKSYTKEKDGATLTVATVTCKASVQGIKTFVQADICFIPALLEEIHRHSYLGLFDDGNCGITPRLQSGTSAVTFHSSWIPVGGSEATMVDAQTGLVLIPHISSAGTIYYEKYKVVTSI